MAVDWVTIVVAVLVVGAVLLILGLRGNSAPAPGPASPGILIDGSAVPQEILDEINAGLAEHYPETAQVAHTDWELADLLAQKLPAWPWAAFVSVLVLRRNAVRDRLRDNSLGFAVATGESARTDRDVARFVIDRISDMSAQLSQLDEVINSRAFRTVLGAVGREDSTDEGDIVHTARRLMDIHDEILRIVERCRGVSVPNHHAELVRDCARYISIPLESFEAFIDDFSARVRQVPESLYFSQGDMKADPVILDIDVDNDPLRDRVFQQLRRITRS